MLSILPFDRLSQKDQERPFKAYPLAPQSSLSSSVYGHFPPPNFAHSISAYPPPPSSSSSVYGNSIISSSSNSKREGSEATGMDLKMEHHQHYQSMYDQSHLMDISHSSNGGPAGRHHPEIKMDPETHAMHYPPVPAGLLGYGNGMPNHHLLHHQTSHHQTTSPPTQLSTMSPVSGMHRSVSSTTTSPTAPSSSGSSGSSDEHTPQCNSEHSSKIPSKKRPLLVPDEMKDNTYWDKRKKNNDSARRSRESRRMKEEQIAMRVVYLEQENLQLRTEVSLLKSEIEKLRCMLYQS